MLKRFFYRIFCGFFLGISIVAPGFSGSLLAIIMGIYHDLVRIVSNPFKDFKRNVKFLLPLGIGAVLSAVLYVLLFDFLFEHYEKTMYLLFVGLIAGNVPPILAEIKKCGFKKHYLFGGAASFAVALTLGVFAVSLGEGTKAAGLTASLPVLALSGLAGGAAALVPGMSVSMILILTGVLGQVMFMASSLLHMDFTYLLPFGLFGLCAIVGLALSSNAIKIVFKKVPGFANSAILGFMAGSLIGIFYQSLHLPDTNFNWLAGGIALFAGLGVSMLFVVIGKVMNKE